MISGLGSRRPVTTQTLAYSTTSATVTNPFGAQTYVIRLSANSACHYKIVEAAGGAASVSDVFLPANWVEYVVVQPGQKIAAIRAATDGLVTATSGTLNVVEMV
jgi:hypothetical protein